MAAAMTRKDLEEIKPKVDKIISKVLGSTDASIVTVVMNCVSSGHDARKICGNYCLLFIVYIFNNSVEFSR